MDYVLFQDIEKNLVYYGVYSTDSEMRDGSDILCKARKKYFETGTKQRDKSTLKTPYEVFRYSYSIEDGVPMKYRKLKGSQQIERVVVTNGGYCIETSDCEHHPIKKTYFDNHHTWIKSEFFSLSDRTAPVFVLFPSEEGDKPILFRKVKNGRTDTLYPFSIMLDKNLTNKLNMISNEPRIFCVTSSGSFYFCTQEEIKERKKALETLFEREKEKSLEEMDAREEIIQQPAFVVDSSKLENQTESTFDLRNSTEIRISDTDDEQSESGTIKSNEFFAKIEEIAKKNHIDIAPEPEKTEPNDTIPEPKPFAILEADDEDEENDDIAILQQKLMVSEEPEEQEEQEEEAETKEEPEEAALTAESPDEETAYDRTDCPFAYECPYEMTDKQIIEAGGRQYYYFGDLDGTKRSGRGRTVMKNGDTAYEGQYLDDKRHGFGVYYYKSGKLCYTGGWNSNQRQGLGIAFSAGDGSVLAGKWQNDQLTGVAASFDSKGKMLYTGNLDNGKKHGAGITYNDDDKTFFVGKYQDGEFLGTGTQFDSEGNLLYTGEYRSEKRNGSGTSYYADGTVEYKGQWLNSQFNGDGRWCLPDGSVIKGSFKNGKAYGKCTLTSPEGKVIYTGSFVDDNYNGTGRLFADDGGYAEGRFVDGEPTGIFNEYTKNKELVYCGEWTDMHRNGRGIEYQNGKKVYEGEFKNSVYHGDGKYYEDGEQVYAGSFVKGKRCGYGTEYRNGEVIYRGIWDNNAYNGMGIIYENGEVRYVGMFSDGMKNGRINEVKDRKIIRKSLYKDNVQIYMCEYSEDGSLSYYGCVKNDMPNGMGCSFLPSCEKKFEGIFKNGTPEKSMKVVLKDLPKLHKCKDLEDTEYDIYRKTPQYIIEKAISNGRATGIYSGRLKDGKPDGSGTILYSDHRYTGMFVDGNPEGEGIIYMNDGREQKGYYSVKPFTDCEIVLLADITYYFSEVI